jgi:pilus assembly protein CpaE
MKPLSIREAQNSSLETLSANQPLSVVGVCLDEETWRALRQFAESAPLVRLRSPLSDYRAQEPDAKAWLGDPAPDICMVDFDRDRSQAAITAENIRNSAPESAVFAVSCDAQPDLIIQAMRSGCSEYLLKPIGQEQLLNALARIGGRRKERTQAFKAQVLGFLGAKGGCGVTSLVTQLGVLLASNLRRKTLIIDLHSGFGDAALYLGLTKYKYHFFELVENSERLDSQLLQGFLVRHASGLELIPAPEGRDAPMRRLPGGLPQILEFLRTRYEHILVDMPPGLSEENLDMITHCDHVHFVTVAEVSALRNVVRHLEYLTRHDVPRERFRVILNRHQTRALIADGEIEKTIGHKLYWKVPNQYAHVTKAINSGHPVANASSSDYARSLKGMAAALGVKSEAGEKRKKSGFLGLLGK